MRPYTLFIPLAVAVLLAGCGGTETTTQAESPAAGTHAPNSPPAQHSGHSMGHGSMPSMVRLQELSGRDFDVAFASEMIEHHQGAVEMSQEALKSAQRAEVKEAARKIIADQEKEITQMTAWVKEWSGQEPDPELRQLMKTDMEPMMTAFRADCQSDCDRAFLTHMKAHHQMAIDMAQMAAAKAEHPELKELATRIIETQGQEMREFDDLLREGGNGSR